MAGLGSGSTWNVRRSETTQPTFPQDLSITSSMPQTDFGSGICDSAYRPQTWSGMGKLLQQEILSDVMLVAEGQSIPCHKFLLASASEYFYNRLVMETENVNHNLIEIEGINFNVLKIIVSYLYTGHINITKENVVDVIPACKMLKLTTACDTCETFALEHVTVANCIGFHKMAMEHDIQYLWAHTLDVMVSNFYEVVSRREFLTMSETDVADYIQNGNLKIPNEDPVFAAVVSWVRCQPREREPSFPRLMTHVRLRYCSPHYLTQVVSKEPLMDNLACQRLLVAVFSHHTSGSVQPDSLCDSSMQCGSVPREGYGTTTILTVVGGISDPGYFLRTECWRPGEAGWKVIEESPIPVPVAFFSSCVMKEGILVTGGCSNGGKTVNQCWLLSTSTYQWSSLRDLNTARARHGSVCLEGLVYVIAGASDGREMSSVECLARLSRKWKTFPDLQKALVHPMAVSHGQCIYVFGGADLQANPSQSVFVYSTGRKPWQILADMPQVCKFGSAVVQKDKIYIVGGFYQSCMCYDPVLAQWSTLSQCRYEHADGPALVWKDRILVCGGRSREAKRDNGNPGSTSVIEEYDPETDTWTVSQMELPLRLNAHFVFST